MDGGLVTATVSLIEEVDSTFQVRAFSTLNRKDYGGVKGWQKPGGDYAFV